MGTQTRKLTLLAAALLLAALIVAAIVVAGRPRAAATPCMNLDQPQEWKNASIEPVPAYAARSESADIRLWIESGEAFRPSARCGGWLRVPTFHGGEPVYVHVDAVDPVPQLAANVAANSGAV